jgi:ribosomal protein S18 acetylase RimI-like enzyme
MDNIKIREIGSKDLKNVKEFARYLNSLVEEDAPILLNKKVGLRAMSDVLKRELEEIKKKKRVSIVACIDEKERNARIAGWCRIWLHRFRENHIAEIAISVAKAWRGKGIGKRLMKFALAEAKKRLKPKPKIFMLGVIPSNKEAIALYKKLGFEKVASIPNKLQYKGRLVAEIVMMKKA